MMMMILDDFLKPLIVLINNRFQFQQKIKNKPIFASKQSSFVKFCFIKNFSLGVDKVKSHLKFQLFIKKYN